LGCGSGVVGLIIAHLRSLPAVSLSDVHTETLPNVKRNFEQYGYRFDFRLGDVFEPWQGERFDVIVDDVSGVAEPGAVHSRWFQGVPCSSGKDGTELVTGVVREAPEHLNASGKLIFPIISLSNSQKILEVARRHFKRVDKVASKDWPMPPELLTHTELLADLEKQGCITLIRKYGLLLGRTEVYVAEEPNSLLSLGPSGGK